MKILGWIIATPFIILALYALLRFAFCRPNYFTVKTATPMIEKMAEHIVTYGIPESLDEIPNLPYELKGCSRKEVYWKDYDVVKTETEAEWVELFLSCRFYKDQTLYSIDSRFTKTFDRDKWRGKISIKSGKTHMGISFKTNKDNQLTHDNIGTGLDNRFGFCRQFKQ